MSPVISATDAVRILNEALELDRLAVETLFGVRVNVNKKLSEHDSIQVNANRTMSVLGLLNGIFGINAQGLGYIAAEVEVDSDNIRGKLVEFVLTSDIPSSSKMRVEDTE